MPRGEADGGVVVGKMVVRGVDYAIRLHTDNPTKWNPQGSARFTVCVSGKDIFADTWEGLYKLAMTASKEAAVKVHVPLLQLAHQVHSWLGPTRFREVVLTSKHAANGNYLIRYSQGNGRYATDQVDRYYHHSDSFYLPMPQEAQAEGLRLMAEARKAEAALSKWQHAHAAVLDKVFEAAEAEAMEKLDRDEGREEGPVVRPTRAKRRAAC